LGWGSPAVGRQDRVHREREVDTGEARDPHIYRNARGRYRGSSAARPGVTNARCLETPRTRVGGTHVSRTPRGTWQRPVCRSGRTIRATTRIGARRRCAGGYAGRRLALRAAAGRRTRARRRFCTQDRRAAENPRSSRILGSAVIAIETSSTIITRSSRSCAPEPAATYDRALSDLVGELSTQSAPFRTRGPPTTSASTTRQQAPHHPIVGDLELSSEAIELSTTGSTL
jgi:hypothetical protein